MDYVAVPIRISGRDSSDTLQITAYPDGKPRTPTAVASGRYEYEMAQRLPAGARLLHSAKDWYRWDDRGLMVISSATLPNSAGQPKDPGDFRRR